MYEQLCRVVDPFRTHMQIDTYNDTFKEVADRISLQQRPDSIIYVNVLEHIADDLGELRLINRALERGGRVFLFVPALQWLYGSFDREIQHFRRYTRAELEAKCVAAGFRVVESRYFDVAGVLPWFVKYRVLRSKRLDARAVKFYDARVVPVAKALEARISPPLGKNLLVV